MTRRMEIRQSVYARDERVAAEIRREMASRGVLLLNLIGSPGAGKTTLLEHTLGKTSLRCAVVEGDVATSRDAARIAALNIPVVQINTQGGCHLEAHLVRRGLEALPLDEVDLVVVENVGNLVCPAEFDLGEDAKVAVSSTAEGDDKPLKYPSLFVQARAVVLTKTDLLPHVPFSRERFWEDVATLGGSTERFEVTALRGEGMGAWITSLEGWVGAKRQVSGRGGPGGAP